MAFSVVQTKVASSGSSTVASLGAAFASPNTAGNLLIVAADIEWGGTIPAMSISDTLGNTWHQPTGFETDPDVSDTGIWYCWNCKGGSNTVTITVDTGVTGGNVNVGIIAREYSGVQNTSDPLDKSAIANGNSSSISSGATAATTNANDLIVGIGTSEQPGATFTAGSGFGNMTVENDANLPHEALAIEDKTVSATGSQTATFTVTSSFWVGAVMAFKAAGGTLHTQSLSGTYSASGTVTSKAVKRTLTASSSTSGSITARAITRTLTAVSRTNGLLNRFITRTLPSASYSASGSLQKKTAISLSATYQTSGSITKRAIARVFTATYSVSGAFTRFLARTLTASYSTAATLNRAISRALAATYSASGSIVKAHGVTKSLSATFQASGTISSRAVTRTFTATYSVSGTITRAMTRTLTASYQSIGGLTRGIARGLSAVFSASASLASSLIHSITANPVTNITVVAPVDIALTMTQDADATLTIAAPLDISLTAQEPDTSLTTVDAAPAEVTIIAPPTVSLL